ncbi:MAG: Ig-like domain-containing protein [Patescibacteria group bacterium]
MSNLNQKTSLFSWFCHQIQILSYLAFFHTIIFFSVVVQAQAQTVSRDPVATGSSVTAFVPDIVAPSTPILISPENSALISNNKPTFIWQGVTDNYAMGHYEFYLDGSLLFDNIPLVNSSNSSYNLTYESSTGRYSLVSTTTISDGTHTWKIRAVDAAGNYADSVTWSFTLDTQSPNFVVTDIGEQNVSISAQDTNTIPTSPIEIETVSPTIVATGEANSQVEMTLSIPGRDAQVYKAQIGSDGKWSMQLNNLPRNTVMYLDFLITDLVGHTSVLQDVPFKVKAEQTIVEIIEEIIEIVRPPKASPTPAVTPTIEVITTPGVTPAVTPKISPAPKPELTVTIKPIKKLATLIPEIVFPRLTPGKRISFPLINLLIALIVPILSTLLVSSRFGWSISPRKLKQIWQIFGYIPRERIQGMVFDSQTNRGVPFAEVSISSQSPNSQYSDSVVSDEQGFFAGLKIPASTYRLSVYQSYYRFPCSNNSADSLQKTVHFSNCFLKVDKTSKMPPLLIAMDRVKIGRLQAIFEQLRAIFTRQARHPFTLTIALMIICSVTSLLFPSFWNWFVVLIYLSLLLIRSLMWMINRRKQNLSVRIIVTDQDKLFVPDAIVRLMPIGQIDDNHQNPFFGQIAITDELGTTTHRITQDPQILFVERTRYCWVELNRQRIAQKLCGEVATRDHLVTIRPVQTLDNEKLANKNLPHSSMDCGTCY